MKKSNWGSPTIRPVDVPRVRDDLLPYLRKETSVERDAASRGVKRGAVEAIPAAPLYSVSSEMTQLAVQAGRSLKAGFNISTQDVPSPTGFLVFSENIAAVTHRGVELPVVGALWYPSPGGEEIAIMWFGDRCFASGPRGVGEYFQDNVTSRLVMAAVEALPMNDTPPIDPAAGEIYEHRATLKAAWLLMGQQLATAEELRVGGPPKRVGGRVVRRPSVRVIQLRRPARDSQNPGDSNGREWHHQWMVRGHWRMQPWGPKRERVRPVWIAPHVKGPEGAPLLGGEKVYHLSR